MLVSLGLLFATPANAFEVVYDATGNAISWASAIQYEVDTSNAPEDTPLDAQLSAIELAMQTWNEVPATGIEIGTYDALPATPNLIYWPTTWTGDEDQLALTSTYTTESGNIVGFEIAINPDVDWGVDGNADEMDLQNMMTHEVGHMLGVDHTAVSDKATMHPSSELGETRKRDLFWDDEEAVRYLYPETPEASGVAGFLGCNVAGGAPIIPALLPLLLLGFRRRS